MIDTVTGLTDLNTALVLGGLVILFVVAFKVIEMLMQTVLVTALSGLFYFALTYFVESVTFSLNSLLFFAFIGGTLYTAYSLLTKSYKVAGIIFYIPIKLLKILKRMIRSMTPSKDKKKKTEN